MDGSNTLSTRVNSLSFSARAVGSPDAPRIPTLGALLWHIHASAFCLINGAVDRRGEGAGGKEGSRERRTCEGKGGQKGVA